MLAVGMAGAVLIDATIVRMVLVPAVMSLLGDAAWWMPKWLDRIMPNLQLEGPVDDLDEPAPDPAPAAPGARGKDLPGPRDGRHVAGAEVHRGEALRPPSTARGLPSRGVRARC